MRGTHRSSEIDKHREREGDREVHADRGKQRQTDTDYTRANKTANPKIAGIRHILLVYSAYVPMYLL